MERRRIPDVFRGHLLFEDHIEPTDPNLYLRHIRQRVIKHIEWDLWLSMDEEAFDTMQRESRLYIFLVPRSEYAKKLSVLWAIRSCITISSPAYLVDGTDWELRDQVQLGSSLVFRTGRRDQPLIRWDLLQHPGQCQHCHLHHSQWHHPQHQLDPS